MITPEMRTVLKNMLIKHEGYERFPYIDTKGKISIGIGFNLTDRGLPDTWINTQYEEDVLYFYNQLVNTFDWFKGLTPNRQLALIDMSFMGFKKILGFTRMIDALAKRDYKRAAQEMIDSEWAKQVGVRAKELALIIETDSMDRL